MIHVSLPGVENRNTRDFLSILDQKIQHLVDMQQSKVRIVKVKGEEGSDGKQKEEEDSIGRGISER